MKLPQVTGWFPEVLLSFTLSTSQRTNLLRNLIDNKVQFHYKYTCCLCLLYLTIDRMLQHGRVNEISLDFCGDPKQVRFIFGINILI